MYLTTNTPQPGAPGTGLVQRINWTTGEEIRDRAGMGCPGTGKPGCKSKASGMGQLFESGTDISGWGIGEWAVVGLGVYTVFSVFSTTKRGVTRTRRAVKAARGAA